MDENPKLDGIRLIRGVQENSKIQRTKSIQSAQSAHSSHLSKVLLSILCGVTIAGTVIPATLAQGSKTSKQAKDSKLVSAANGTAKASGQQSQKAKPAQQSKQKNPEFWPPMLTQFFPDMTLVNQDGRPTKLSDYKGKIIILQFASMNCPLSQAYSGANRPGFHPLGSVFPPSNVKFFPDLMRDLTGYGLQNPGVVWMQILVYNDKGEMATPKDVRRWAKHFDLKTADKQFVLAPEKSMMSKKTKLMVPGFQLINRAFVLTSDSTGALPKDDLYSKFLPTLTQQFY